MTDQKATIDKVKQILEEYDKKMKELEKAYLDELQKIIKEEIVRVEANQKASEDPDAMLKTGLMTA